MNRRNQEIVSDEALVAYLVKNYTYDAERGVVVNRKLNRVVKGCINGRGYMDTRLWLAGKQPHIQLHHMVWVVTHGCFPKVIDHINGDASDNRIENLREVSAKENSDNRMWAWRPNPRTGVPGVSAVNRGFHIRLFTKRFFFTDKYEAFHTLILLGRTFKS